MAAVNTSFQNRKDTGKSGGTGGLHQYNLKEICDCK